MLELPEVTTPRVSYVMEVSLRKVTNSRQHGEQVDFVVHYSKTGPEIKPLLDQMARLVDMEREYHD